jgi:hypothetical protein
MYGPVEPLSICWDIPLCILDNRIEVRLIWIWFSAGCDWWDGDLYDRGKVDLNLIFNGLWLLRWGSRFLPDKNTRSLSSSEQIFTNKVGLDDHVDCLKAHLVAKGCTHIFYMNYSGHWFVFSYLWYDSYVKLASLSVGYKNSLLTLWLS